MPEVSVASHEIGLAAKARRAPLGILLIAGILGTVGVGLVAVGVYLALADGVPTLWAGILALVMGPSILYLAYHLLSLAPWARLALLVVTGLLFVSSLVRFAVTPDFPAAAVMEIAAELGMAYYLLRRRVRTTFGRT